jgi:hypothetical protein
MGMGDVDGWVLMVWDIGGAAVLALVARCFGARFLRFLAARAFVLLWFGFVGTQQLRHCLQCRMMRPSIQLLFLHEIIQ